jgi:hypothetical protein
MGAVGSTVRVTMPFRSSRIRQRLVGDAIKPPLDRIEACRPWAEHREDQDRPLVSDLVQHWANPRHVGERARGQGIEIGIIDHI